MIQQHGPYLNIVDAKFFFHQVAELDPGAKFFYFYGKMDPVHLA